MTAVLHESALLMGKSKRLKVFLKCVEHSEEAADKDLTEPVMSRATIKSNFQGL